MEEIYVHTRFKVFHGLMKTVLVKTSDLFEFSVCVGSGSIPFFLQYVNYKIIHTGLLCVIERILLF